MDDVVERAALGQVGGLGDIYDAVLEKIVGSQNEPLPSRNIRTQNHPRQLEFNVIVDNGYPSAFSLLEVPSDQQASYLVRMLDPHLSGSGLFLKDEKKLDKTVRSVMKLSIRTKTETLDVSSRPEDLKTIATGQGTHLISQIEWGATLILVFEYKNDENEDESKVTPMLQSYVQKLANTIAVGPPKKRNHKLSIKIEAINVKMYCDWDDKQFEESLKAVQTVPAAIILAKKFAKNFREGNGFGKPLKYVLAPRTNLQVLLASNLISQNPDDAYFSEGCLPMRMNPDSANDSVSSNSNDSCTQVRRWDPNSTLEKYFAKSARIDDNSTEDRCVVASKNSRRIPFGHLESLLYPIPITDIVVKLYSKQEPLTTVEKLVVVFEKIRMDLQKLESECKERKEMAKYVIKLTSSHEVEKFLKEFKEKRKDFVEEIFNALVSLRRRKQGSVKLSDLIMRWENREYWGGTRNFSFLVKEHMSDEPEKRNFFRQLMSRKVQAIHHNEVDAFVHKPSVAQVSAVIFFYHTPRRDNRDDFDLNCKFLLTCLKEKCEAENKTGSYDAGNSDEIHNVLFEKNLKTPVNHFFDISRAKSESDVFLGDLQRIPQEIARELLGANELNENFEITVVGYIPENAQSLKIELKNDTTTLLSYESEFAENELILKSGQNGNYGQEENRKLQLKQNTFFNMRICRDSGGFKILVDGKPELNYYNTFQCSSRHVNLSVSGDATISVLKVDLLMENKSSGIFQGFPFVDKKAEYVFVDCDLIDEDNDGPCMAPTTSIHVYENKKVVSKNLVKDSISYLSRRIVKCVNPLKKVYIKPRKRCYATLRCPQSFNRTCQCDGVKNVWLCWKCQERLEYGFDDHFYCSCGKEEVTNFRFRCEGEMQSQAFIQFQNKNDLTSQLRNLQPFKEMNILLLGGTGVGKSTWINGLANYLNYETLQEATENDIVALIPSSFILTNDQFEEVVISVGRDSNEVLVSGQSATQQPTSYTLVTGNNTLVRIIDTPGIGDTRGIAQDKINFQEIMSHISHIDNLHGICILLKPNEARLGIVFEFCLKELLTHLHRDAAENIVFCFTNARSTFYRPGDTMASLKSLIASQPTMASLIRLNKDTVYCMDNEAFRFLAALKHGEDFDDEEKDNFSKSWVRSVNETGRLMDHFKRVKPHGTKNTVTLNSTRQIILKLAKPIAEISQNIQTNIALLKDRENELINSNQQYSELASKLYVPQSDLEIIELSYPKTVCGSTKCIENLVMAQTCNTGTIYKANYKQVCHAHCYLTGVVTNTLNLPALQHCAAMTHVGGVIRCAHCSCCWSQHLHITYDVRQRTVTTMNKSVEQGLVSAEEQKSKIQAVVKQCKDRFTTYEEEQKAITKASAQFAVFLKNNAITPYNDALMRYLDHIIDIEDEKIRKKGNKTTRDGLKQMKDAYELEVRVLEDAIKNPTKAGDVNMTPESIQNALESLYKLPLSGPTIKKLVTTADTSERMLFAEKNFMRKSMLNRYSKGDDEENVGYGRNSGSGSSSDGASYFKRKFKSLSSQAKKWF